MLRLYGKGHTDEISHLHRDLQEAREPLLRRPTGRVQSTDRRHQDYKRAWNVWKLARRPVSLSMEHGEELWEIWSEGSWERGGRQIMWDFADQSKNFGLYTWKEGIREVRIGRGFYLHFKRILFLFFPLPKSLSLQSLHLPYLYQNLGKVENLLHSLVWYLMVLNISIYGV